MMSLVGSSTVWKPSMTTTAMKTMGGGGNAKAKGMMMVECSSRPQKKATAHHMKTRPKKSQPWDIRRKGPTVYPPLPPLPPDWTLVEPDAGDAVEADSPAPALSSPSS
ncbi:hypothetical protein J5N97_024652 [Dioscorea zingiberensis]|uniref:50S ribosomal protein 6, chloroplastic n=1 Tax=Dioscorea zingiberensis TaxID=325984 RepID=A0A9D5C7S0_9LILI|nr:hypothetical protein J5N97_024652 [Dioscorea zingiberensis]